MGGISSRNMDIEHDPGLAAVLQYLIRRLVQCYLIGERFSIIVDLSYERVVYVWPLIERDRKGIEVPQKREVEKMTEGQRERENEQTRAGGILTSSSNLLLL